MSIGWIRKMEQDADEQSIERRYCSQCRFLLPISQDDYLWRCNAPANLSPNINLVTGQPIPYNHTAHQAREHVLYCGPDARWFESRKVHRDNWGTNAENNELGVFPRRLTPLNQRLRNLKLEDI